MLRGIVAAGLAGLTSLTACTGLMRELDRAGLEDAVEALMWDGPTGDPASLRRLAREHDLARDTAPTGAQIHTARALDDWTVELDDGTEVTPTVMRFTSHVGRPDQSDNAVFYFYAGRSVDRAIVWAPGMGFGERAFTFIDDFFIAALEQGWSVAVWVPPYHRERRAGEADDGDGFLAADPAANFRLLLTGVAELRTVVAWLRARGAERVGGWGGSMGAAMLLLAESVEPLDHLTVMIPVVDWRALMLENELTAPAVGRLVAAGYDRTLLEQAYRLLSPADHALRVDPARVQILYARYDQLTPEATIRKYAADRGITAVRAYEHSHATILLAGDLDADYRAFLARVTETEQPTAGRASR
jgi:hypothetical protein